MSVSFEDFLTSAKALLDNPSSTEMDFRNLISRSYYSLFHLSKQQAITLSLPIPNSVNSKEFDAFNGSDSFKTLKLHIFLN